MCGGDICTSMLTRVSQEEAGWVRGRTEQRDGLGPVPQECEQHQRASPIQRQQDPSVLYPFKVVSYLPFLEGRMECSTSRVFLGGWERKSHQKGGNCVLPVAKIPVGGIGESAPSLSISTYSAQTDHEFAIVRKNLSVWPTDGQC